MLAAERRLSAFADRARVVLTDGGLWRVVHHRAVAPYGLPSEAVVAARLP